MNIVTEYIHPPISLRDWDWQAVDDDTYEGDPRQPIGYGRTEQKAIQDLLEQIEKDDG
jgi:hypothetical protein